MARESEHLPPPAPLAALPTLHEDFPRESPRQRQHSFRDRRVSSFPTPWGPPYPTFGSISYGDESDDGDESFYVQQELPGHAFTEAQLLEHIKRYNWDEYGKKILSKLLDSLKTTSNPDLFPKKAGPVEDRSHMSHHQVFDVRNNGIKEEVEPFQSESKVPHAVQIWNALKELNHDPDKPKAVGRITIVREPSPVLFAALHLTMDDNFCMDRLFQHLVESEASSANAFQGFEEEERTRRTLVFNLEYYTIIDLENGCEPMEWQRADKQRLKNDDHVALSRCSAVVALSLHGNPVQKIRNPGRRAKTKHGFIYDPWAPWQVLNIQCNPDEVANLEAHLSSNNYVNGPDAFLATLLTEFRDAQKRFDHIYKAVTKLITPGLDILFDEYLRDRRLFEDANFTFTRRYFWANQTLGIMNDSLKAIIDTFEDQFPEDVWDAKSRTIWPLPPGEDESPRSEFWKKRLRSYQRSFQRELERMRLQIEENEGRRREIVSLRDQLFSGTSVLESRKSVECAEITIQQGHNIKLLTLVSIFFLPLTFVTGVFGMTNMPQEPHYWMFGITVATVCIPFFLLIGSLNSKAGYEFWKQKWNAMWKRLKIWMKRGEKEKDEETPARALSLQLTASASMPPGRETMNGHRGANGHRARTT